jgi:DHA1 family bicyclomycin/chloramphenicol resistance-like MFS transporter
LAGLANIYSTLALIFLFLCTIGITNPNTAALGLAPFSRNAGTAAALLGALQLGIGSIVSTSVSLFDSLSVVPLAMVLLVTSVIAFIILFVSLRVNRDKFVAASADNAVVMH